MSPLPKPRFGDSGAPAEPFNFCFARQGGAEAVAKKARACRFATPLIEAACSAGRSVGRNRRAISLPAHVPTRRPKHPGRASSVSLRGGAKRIRDLGRARHEAQVSNLRFLGSGDTRVLRLPHEEGQVPSTARRRVPPSLGGVSPVLLTPQGDELLSLPGVATSQRPHAPERGQRTSREARGRDRQTARLFDLRHHPARGGGGPRRTPRKRAISAGDADGGDGLARKRVSSSGACPCVVSSCRDR